MVVTYFDLLSCYLTGVVVEKQVFETLSSTVE
jgi:hypothetical protein